MISFLKDRSGASAVEFALISPVILLLLLGSLTVFDLYRSYGNVVQANYVVADMVSRETSLSPAYLDRLYGVYGALVSSGSKPTAMRISSLLKKDDKLTVQWSVDRGEKTLLPVQALSDAVIPDIAEQDSVIYIEAVQKQTTLSSIFGMDGITFSPEAYVRPRFISAIALTN